MTLGTAIISDDGLYRYLLTRQCEGEGATMVVMVNPSTADATQDDATIRKVQGFGNRNAWGEVRIVNLFAYRSTDINGLRFADDPIGPENDFWLWHVAEQAKQIIVAWGSIGKIPLAFQVRPTEVMAMLECARIPILAIGDPLNCGHPRHPLMPPYTSPLQEWKLP